MEKYDLTPGQVLAGKYRIERLLGRGGMGLVFAAKDVALQRLVAIKILLPALAAEKESVARFLREARAAVKLTSEHSVRVYDVSQSTEGVPFMVMEFLSGRDLGTVIEDERRIPVGRAVDYLLQAVEAIAEAHSAGIIHRDIKPQNLFLTRKADGAPLVKVLDFGLAKAPKAIGEMTLTSASAVMGSPQYMSPEQMRGSRDVDHRTDIWALGVSLYEMVTGQCPFDAPTVPDLVVKVLHATPTPAHVLYEDVPRGLSIAIARCLEKDASERFANVAELAKSLDPYAESGRGAAPRISRVLHANTQPQPQLVLARTLRAEAVDAKVETATVATLETTPARSRRFLWLGAAGLIMVVSMMAVSTGLARGRTEAPAASMEPTPAAAPASAAASASALSPGAAPSASIPPLAGAGSASGRGSELASGEARASGPLVVDAAAGPPAPSPGAVTLARGARPKTSSGKVSAPVAVAVASPPPVEARPPAPAPPSSQPGAHY